MGGTCSKEGYDLEEQTLVEERRKASELAKATAVRRQRLMRAGKAIIQPVAFASALDELPVDASSADGAFEGATKRVPEGVYPLLLTPATQEKFGCVERVHCTAAKPYAMLPKAALLEDARFRGGASDFHACRHRIAEHDGDELMVVWDESEVYGQNFFLAYTAAVRDAVLADEAARNALAAAPPPTTTPVAEASVCGAGGLGGGGGGGGQTDSPSGSRRPPRPGARPERAVAGGRPVRRPSPVVARAAALAAGGNLTQRTAAAVKHVTSAPTPSKMPAPRPRGALGGLVSPRRDPDRTPRRVPIAPQTSALQQQQQQQQLLLGAAEAIATSGVWSRPGCRRAVEEHPKLEELSAVEAVATSGVWSRPGCRPAASPHGCRPETSSRPGRPSPRPVSRPRPTRPPPNASKAAQLASAGTMTKRTAAAVKKVTSLHSARKLPTPRAAKPERENVYV